MDSNRWKRRNDGEVGSPAMEPDTNYREETDTSLVSKSSDEDGSSNPSGRLLSDSVALKTRGGCL